MTTIAPDQYIENRGTSFRVRFPKGMLNKRNFQTCTTLQEAQDVRDRFLASLIGTPEPVEAPRPQVASVAAPDRCPKPLQFVQSVTTLQLNRWLYCSDIHAPVHDPTAIERLVAVGRSLGVDNLVIGGDWFDLAEMSAHGDDIEMPDVNDAIEVSGQVLRYVKSYFENVHILPGNHCRRLAKRLNKNLSFRNLVRMAVGDITGFTITENDYFLVNDSTPERPGWTVGHPRFFAAFPTKGLETVAVMRQRNVIGAHSHTWGCTKIGKFICISPGHLMRPDLTPYLVRSGGLSKHPDQEPSQGFVFVETTPHDGDIVQMFGEGVTRWSDYASK